MARLRRGSSGSYIRIGLGSAIEAKTPSSGRLITASRIRSSSSRGRFPLAAYTKMSMRRALMSELGKPSASRETMVTRSSCTRSSSPARISGPNRAPFAAWIQTSPVSKASPRSTERAKALASPRATTPSAAAQARGTTKFDKPAKKRPAIKPPIATGSTIRNGERPHAAAVTTSPSFAMRYTARVAPRPAAKGREYSSMGRATKNKNSAMSPAESKSPRPNGRRAAPKTAKTNTTARVYPTERNVSLITMRSRRDNMPNIREGHPAQAGWVMLPGSSNRSNSSGSTKPRRNVSSRTVDPVLNATLAISAASS